MTVAPTMPMRAVADRLISEMAVSERITFCEQALDAAGEDFGLLGFGVIPLDDANAGQRFGEAAGDVGVDLAALAEDRADTREGRAQAQGESQDEQERDRR